MSLVRIASLVPSATETLFALGLDDDIIAVTHECDHPEQALELPQLTRNALPEGLNAGEIDAAVRARTDQGESIYELDSELLAELEPDLIVTQAQTGHSAWVTIRSGSSSASSSASRS